MVLILMFFNKRLLMAIAVIVAVFISACSFNPALEFSQEEVQQSINKSLPIEQGNILVNLTLKKVEIEF